MDTEMAVKLPLWKSCLEDMQKAGLEYGQVFKAEYFEGWLKSQRDSMEFGLGLSEIRREMEKSGFYLSGRGNKGAQFVILAPEANADVIQGYQRSAMDNLRRGLILGTTTKLDSLTDAERTRHEQIVERIAVKSALMQRSTAIYKAVKKAAPKLLETEAAC